MPSLKEVKNRIASVANTRKITSAMKMVASSKLHRAQQSIESMRPYERILSHMMESFVAALPDDESPSPLTVSRPVHRTAVVLFTSNSSLCGGFNLNAVKKLNALLASFKTQGVEISSVLCFGKKGYDAVSKDKSLPTTDLSALLDHPSYAESADVAKQLMDQYVKGEIDEVVLLYHHFKSAGVQVLTEQRLLPLALPEATSKPEEGHAAVNYIVEPSAEELVAELIPKTVSLTLFTSLLDSLASEHAARVVAMQVATDNADDLLHDLKLTYNKTRQQAITNELLDIVAGSAQ